MAERTDYMKRSEYLNNARSLYRERKVGPETYEAMIQNVDAFTDESDLDEMTVGDLLYYSTYTKSCENEYIEELCKRAGMSEQYRNATIKDFGKREKENVVKVAQQAAKQFNCYIV